MTISLRPAVATDLMAVGALHQRSRAAAYAHFLPPEALVRPTPEAMGQYWSERWAYERDTHRMTVAERDGALVGFTYVGPDDHGDDPDALLCAIHLDPGEQGRGTGLQLMEDALATMRDLGWKRAVLWVLRQNEHARRFYERGGWVADGEERDEELFPGVTTSQLRYARPL